MAFKVRIFGIKQTHKTMRLLIKNIPKESEKLAENELIFLKKAMKKKIKLFEFEGQLGRSFVIDTPRKTDGLMTKRLRNVAPYAVWVDQGVEAHAVPVGAYNPTKDTGLNRNSKSSFSGQADIKNIDKLVRWAEKKIGFVPRWIYPGGRNSAIKKGNSKRQFYGNTIREYAASNRLGKETNKAVNEALKKSER